MPFPNWSDVATELRTKTDLRTGMVVEESYLHKGRRHRDPEEGPAFTRRSRTTGCVIFEVYYWQGKVHREDGPAIIGRWDTGKISREGYCLFGEMHRDPRLGPANIEYHPDGRVRRAEYFVKAERHRENGPADYFATMDGKVTEVWYNGGVLLRYRDRLATNGLVVQDRHHITVDGGRKLSRPLGEGPAVAVFDPETGLPIREEFWLAGIRFHMNYYKDGKLHRPPKEGPARIEYNPSTGRPAYSQYWLHGVRVNQNGARFEP